MLPGASGGLNPVGTGGATGAVPGCGAGIPSCELDGELAGVCAGFGTIKSSGDVAGGNSALSGSVGCPAAGGGGVGGCSD